MNVYRIVQKNYEEDLTGTGAKLFGGRWNSPGQFALYTAENRSLALLELLAHVPIKLLTEKKYYLITLYLPEDDVEIINTDTLPNGWQASDSYLYTQKKGDGFLTPKKKLCLCVPSVMMNEEKNYIINPLHPNSKKIKIISKRIVKFDSRFSK